MKNQLRILMLIMLPIISFSQVQDSVKFRYSIGKPYKYIRSYTNINASLNGNLINIKKKSNDLIIQKLSSSTLNFESEKRYNDQREYGVIEHVGVMNNRMYLFYSVWDKKNEYEQLFYREIDSEKGVLVGEDYPMFKIKGKIVGSMEGVGSMYGVQNIGKFKFDYSKDSSKLMVFYRKISERRNDAKNFDKIGFHVYGQNIEPLWHKVVTMPYTEKKMNNIDYLVGNNGNAYILATVFGRNSSKQKLKEGKPNFRLEIMRISPDKSDIEIFPTTLDNQLTNSIRFVEGNNNEIICAGFFTKNYTSLLKEIMSDPMDRIMSTRSLDAKGIFSFRIDESGNISDKGVYEFTLKLLNQNESKKTKKKNNKKGGKETELQNFVMERIITEEDGSVIIIGEQAYSVNKGSKMPVTYYYYKDIIVGKINNNGELAWIKKLPKQQVGKDTGLADMSFTHFYSKGNHYFFFLDNINNIDLIESEKPKAHQANKGGMLTAYTVVSSTGDVAKSYILDVRDINRKPFWIFKPGLLLQISDNEFIFEATSKNKEGSIVKVKRIE